MSVAVTSHKGIEITVSGRSGWFEATVGDVGVQAETLAALREKIDRELRGSKQKAKMAIPVLIVLKAERASWENVAKFPLSGMIYTATLTGWNRNTGDPQFVGIPRGYYRDNTYPIAIDTPQARELYEAERHLQKELTKLRNELGRRSITRDRSYGRVEIERYNSLIAEAKGKYAEVLALDGAGTDNASVSEDVTEGSDEMEKPHETREDETEGTRDTVPGDPNQPRAEEPLLPEDPDSEGAEANQ